MKVTELLDRIADLEVDTDLPVIIAADNNRFCNRAEPKHVQVQRVCNQNVTLAPCDSARCEQAFLALVIW